MQRYLASRRRSRRIPAGHLGSTICRSTREIAEARQGDSWGHVCLVGNIGVRNHTAKGSPWNSWWDESVSRPIDAGGRHDERSTGSESRVLLQDCRRDQATCAAMPGLGDPQRTARSGRSLRSNGRRRRETGVEISVWRPCYFRFAGGEAKRLRGWQGRNLARGGPVHEATATLSQIASRNLCSGTLAGRSADLVLPLARLGHGIQLPPPTYQHPSGLSPKRQRLST